MNELLKLLRSLWEWSPATTDRSISREKHLAACMMAGLVSQVIVVLIMLAGWEIGGYANLERGVAERSFVGGTITEFRFLWPRLIISQLGLAIAIAWLTHKLAFQRTAAKGIWRLGVSAIILLVGFLLGALTKQLGARNSLAPCETEFRFLELKEKTYGSVGGPLGTPDFETIATGLAVAFGLLLTVNLLRRYDFPPRAVAMSSSLTIALWSCAAYGMVFFCYQALINAGVLELEGDIGSPCLFKYQFPHPERIGIVAIRAFANTLLVSALLWSHSARHLR